MIVTIQTRKNNKIEVLRSDSDALRYSRMSKKLSLFFDLIKDDDRYAKNNRSKGKYIPVFVTLTYKDMDSWDCKDISGLIHKYRKYWTSGGKNARMKKEDFRYVWVAELQKRGVIHYHICFWLPRFTKLSDLKPDSLGWWTKGHTNAVAIKKSVFAYLSKYLSKGAVPCVLESGETVFHRFPKGARIYGSGGLTKIQRVKTSYKLLPEWVKGIFIDDEVQVRRKKGGFQQGNVFLASPYVIIESKSEFQSFKDIIYVKKWSLLSAKESEIEWDEKVRDGHPDTKWYSPTVLTTPDCSTYAEMKERDYRHGRQNVL